MLNFGVDDLLVMHNLNNTDIIANSNLLNRNVYVMRIPYKTQIFDL